MNASHVVGWILALLACALPAQGHGQEGERLQDAFASAKNLELIHQVTHLPPDAVSKIEHIAWLHGNGLAEFGDDWQMGDAPRPGVPRAQHLFSAVSEDLVAVAFLTSVLETKLRLIIAKRHSPSYCLLSLSDQSLLSLQLSRLQQLARSQAASQCVEQNVNADFRTTP